MTGRDVETFFKQPQRQRSKRGGLPRMSSRRRRAERELATNKRFVRERSAGWCEVPRCPNRAAEVHHIVARSGGMPDHSVENLADLCDPHHDQVHDDPKWAKRVGLKVSRR